VFNTLGTLILTGGDYKADFTQLLRAGWWGRKGLENSLGAVASAKRECGLSAQIWTHNSKPTFSP